MKSELIIETNTVKEYNYNIVKKTKKKQLLGVGEIIPNNVEQKGSRIK